MNVKKYDSVVEHIKYLTNSRNVIGGLSHISVELLFQKSYYLH